MTRELAINCLIKDDKVKTREVVFYDIGTGVMTYGSIPEPSLMFLSEIALHPDTPYNALLLLHSADHQSLSDCLA